MADPAGLTRSFCCPQKEALQHLGDVLCHRKRQQEALVGCQGVIPARPIPRQDLGRTQADTTISSPSLAESPQPPSTQNTPSALALCNELETKGWC